MVRGRSAPHVIGIETSYLTHDVNVSVPFQHVQLLAWEPGRSNEASMVTVRPNFQDSVHVGHVSGLKKFTEYYSSVLCFTTPGDGPRSPPQRFRTHEDSECSPLALH